MIIVVTGATGYLGSRIVARALERGHRVVALLRSSRSIERLESSVKSVFERHRDSVCYIEQDLLRVRDFREFSERIYRCFGPIDSLVNSAAVWDDTDPMDLSVEKWLEVLTLNLVVPYQLSIALSRYMKSGSVIVNISCLSSTRGHRVYGVLRPSPAYVASKTALNQVTRILADILAERRIIVVGVAPSWIEKPGLERYREYIERQTPMREAADPLEVADFIVSLIENRILYMSGSIIELPGGI